MTAMNGDIRRLASEINVTPMIDVLLVLLIIFMVIVPAVPRGETAAVPQASPNPFTGAIVLEVMGEPATPLISESTSSGSRRGSYSRDLLPSTPTAHNASCSSRATTG